MQITLESILKLHPLDIRKDKRHYIVHDFVTTDFFEMNEVCIAAINQIKEGIQLGEIERKLKSQFPQEEINLLEFAEQLVELKIVGEIDGNLIEINESNRDKLGFTQISSKLGMLFFNKPIKFFYKILFLLNILLFIFNPHLFPHYKDVFIFGYMFQNVLAWIVMGGILVLLHEMGHILAIRSYDLPTKLEVGHRLFMVVLETDLSLGWKLPLKDRISLYLSGLSFDNIILFFALITQLLFPDSSNIVQSIMAFVVLDVVIRSIYQCCVFMKTDLYYVLENVTGCHNLMENAKDYFNKAFKLKEKNTTTTVFEGEQKVVFLYGVLYFLGVILSITIFLFYYLPQLVYMIIRVVPGLLNPITSPFFWDSLMVILQIVLALGLLIFAFLKKRKTV
jgi:putative peptide zinc metalloprotease protein